MAGCDRGTAEAALFEVCVAEAQSQPNIADLKPPWRRWHRCSNSNSQRAVLSVNEFTWCNSTSRPYLLRSLLNEQGRRIFEIHRLAAAYGWSLDEILSLTRTERRRLVEQVEDEISRRRTQR